MMDYCVTRALFSDLPEDEIECSNHFPPHRYKVILLTEPNSIDEVVIDDELVEDDEVVIE